MIKVISKTITKFHFIAFLFLGSISTSYAFQLDTLIIESKSMQKPIKNIVITPENHSSQADGFPVLYLLHGAGGSFVSWPNLITNLQDDANKYNMIIVCPDGGVTSWYFDSPIDNTMKYETYISKELIEAIDSKYNTLKNKNSRAIAGLSMGGHGAFYLAFKHQDIWGAAGSMSGGVDFRPFTNNWNIPKRLGAYATHKDNWENNTVINMLHLLKRDSLKLIFDCGTDDFFYDGNKRLHTKMLERNIPHDYIERPGAHNSDYWKNAIKYQLVFFNNFFNSKL